MRVVERVWEWHFPSPPEMLWPILADTNRFNEAMRFPRYTVSETPLPDGSVRRVGSARRFGLTLTWDEGVPQWIAGRRYAHRRDYHFGPLRALATEIEFDPEEGGSRVRFRVRAETGGWFGALLMRFGLRYRLGPGLDCQFRAAAASVAAADPGFAPPAPDPPASLRERVAGRAKALAEQGYAATDRLASHLLSAPETDLERMRPRAMARLWNLPPRAVIETFLAAAREGLLALRWDLLCPRCRGAKIVATSLDRLPQGAHCPSCNIDYERDFTQNVELTFEPARDIRALGIGEYCLASPVASAHVKIQQTVLPGAGVVLAADLPDGDYRARTIDPGGSTDFRVAAGIVPEITLGDGDPVLTPGRRGDIRAHNAGDAPRILVIEDRAWAEDALTAHEVTTMQAFRDLFADAVLRPGDQVAIRGVTLLFTDIKGSSALYNEVGDARAYGWVREHYAVLTGAVRRHDGAVVKTIGDAVMAAFSNPAGALAAALAIRGAIAEFDRERGAATPPLVVKLGLHCGPCIAVTLNDRLDYFGRTVNLAARLQSESRGGDIVLSAAMAEEPEMAALLAPLGAQEETVRVKGFAEPVRLYRVPATGEGLC